MRMKKTWFSYVLWLPYTALTGIGLAVCVTSAVTGWGFNGYAAPAAVCVTFAATLGVWLAGRKAAPFLAERMRRDAHFYNMWECFLAMCIFAGAILIRLRLFPVSIPPEAGKYFELALVTQSGDAARITHGASGLYTTVLSILFTLLGNKAAVGILFQFLLQLMLLPVLYFALRLLAGRVSALVAAAIAAFSPVFTKAVFVLSPESLYLLLYALGLLLTGLCLRGTEKNGGRKSWALPGFLLIGLYAGMMTWLDLTGVTLFFFVFAAPLSVRKGKAKKNRINPWALPAVMFPGILLSFGLLLAADAAYAGQPVLQAAGSFFKQYGWDGMGRNPWSGLFGGGAAAVLVCVCAAFHSTGFWFQRWQKSDPFILLLLALFVCGISESMPMDYGMPAAIVWGVFSGLGLSSIVEGSCFVADAPAGAPVTEPYKEKAQESASCVIRPEENERPRFIPNPLPLPKKHEKREMDFEKDPKEEEADFDTDVAEYDDFDLK